MKRPLLLLPVFLLACAPAIDPAMQQATDALLATHDATGATFEPPAGAAPPPWAVGQWALYQSLDEHERPTVSRYAVIAQDECGWWLEFATQSYTDVTRARYCFTKQPEASDATSGERVANLVAIVETEAEGRVTRMDLRKPEYAFMRGLQVAQYEAVVRGLRVSADTPRETITVPAGTFNDALKVSSTVSYGPLRVDSVTWSSSEVPVMGMVRSETRDGKHRQVLLAWGDEGAESGNWPQGADPEAR